MKYVSRLSLSAAMIFCLSGAAPAATPAESFISGNLQSGMAILSDAQLSAGERKARFETFLLGVTDMKRIAAFTLGQYDATASPADKDAFAAAFQEYAVAVYQSYFGRYFGQSLSITRSYARAPGDVIVVTAMHDPGDHSGQPPLEIDFRVRTDAAGPKIVDFGVAGIWLALSERDDFVAVLGRNHGDMQALIAQLHQSATQQ